MGTIAGSNLAHLTSSEFYDPDECVARGSPMLAAKTVKLQPSPSPPPFIAFPAKVSYLPAREPDCEDANKYSSSKPNAGDAMLVAVLGGGRNPDIAARAAVQGLPSDTDGCESDVSDCSESVASPRSAPFPSEREAESVGPDGEQGIKDEVPRTEADIDMQNITLPPATSPQPTKADAFDLKSLAAGALSAFTAKTTATIETVYAGPTPPVMENDVGIGERRQRGTTPAAILTRRDIPNPDERGAAPAGPSAYASPYSPNSSLSSPNFNNFARMDPYSPTILPGNSKGELPPMQMHSPRSETNGHTPLPSISAQLGDLRELQEQALRREASILTPAYPQSPPGVFPPLAMQKQHASPSVSPADQFHHSLPSPRHTLPLQPALPLGQQALGMSPPSSLPIHAYQFSQQPQGFLAQAYAGDVGNRALPPLGTDGRPGDRPLGQRMSIDLDELTIAGGSFHCPYPDCKAAPFQTQYLLNSHANVHSSSRPHFCPVKGCARAEGGKGFKRKNEMIRHGLVHDSPGYVCPFCPDREHKYPRPDNLQR